MKKTIMAICALFVFSCSTKKASDAEVILLQDSIDNGYQIDFERLKFIYETDYYPDTLKYNLMIRTVAGNIADKYYGDIVVMLDDGDSIVVPEPDFKEIERKFLIILENYKGKKPFREYMDYTKNTFNNMKKK